MTLTVSKAQYFPERYGPIGRRWFSFTIALSQT